MIATAPAATTNETIAIEFFKAWFANCDRGWITIWTGQDKRTHWFHVKEYKTAAEAAIQLSERNMDVYFGVGLQQKRLSSGRGSADTILSIPGVWMDLDYGDTHAEKNLPPTLEAAMDLLWEFPSEPSIVVHSGHGLHGYWKFFSPWEIETKKEREKAKRYLERFQGTIRHYAAKHGKHGWKLDNTSDLARVLRVPGTMNRKGDPVEVTIQHPAISPRTH